MSDPLRSDEAFPRAAGRMAALRRVSGPEIIDEGIQLGRQNYEALLTAALVPLLPSIGIRLWLYAYPHRFGVWSSVLLILSNTVWASLAFAAAGRVAMDAIEGTPLEPARGLRIAFRRVWSVVLSGLYRSLFVLLGLAVLLIPGLYVASVYALIPVLPVLEPQLGAWQALRRSATLTSSARLLAFGAYVAPYYFVAALGGALTLLTTRVMPLHVGQLLGAVAGIALALMTAPFIAGIQVRLYVELRMRKEAIDIEWALASMSRGATQA